MNKTTKEKIIKPKKTTALSRSKKSNFSTNPKLELKKVTWPDNKVLIKSTLLVLSIIVISTLYIMGLDLLFSNTFKFLKEIF